MSFMIIKRVNLRHGLLLVLFLCVVVSFTPHIAAAQSGLAQAEPAAPGARILRSDAAGLHFQLNTTPFQINEDGQIHVDSLEQTISDPGAPALPYYSTLIALPPQAAVSVSVTESGLSTRRAVEVPPVPQEQLHAVPDDSGILAADPATITEIDPLFTKDEAIYALDASFPKVRYELSEPLYLRDLRLVELKLFPLTYNPIRRTVSQTANLSVQLAFSGADFDNLKPSPGFVDKQAQALGDKILNFDQAHAWRSLPPQAPEAATSELPIGADTFKILVDQDGIYEISGAELAAQGMSLPVDPATIEMMHGGLPVAFQFIDVNGGGQFDAGDKIRFYGWAFDGSRHEQMYVNDNVFWLWAGGSASSVPVVANEAGAGTVVTSFVDVVTRQDEDDNFSGWAVEWANEPTLWHMDRLTAAAGVTASKLYGIELPDPLPGAAGNSVTVELTTNLNPFAIQAPTYTARTVLNSSAVFGQISWRGRNNLNVVKEFPAADFKQPADAGYPLNQVQVDLSSNSSGPVTVQITRITVEYTRLLKALNDQLIFSHDQNGQHDFPVSGFGIGDTASAVAWDISDPRRPEHIAIDAQNITGSSGDFTLTFGRSHGANAQFIATTTANIQTVKEITPYVPVSIDPPSGEAEWLAITHSSLRTAAETLAAHRDADFSTWVVNIEDIVNQVGYGFNTPETIRTYLSNALANWNVGPHYVTLFGDATRNPLQQDCPLCNPWDASTPTLLVTDFAFVDRWNGMVPSDFTMALLVGNDLLADVRIGRIPANNLGEANDIVQKVILFETQRLGLPEDWQRHFLFIADNTDAAGNFCDENQRTGHLIPNIPFDETHLCLPASTTTDTADLLAEMGEQINNVGTSVVNYRGHGSTTAWASGPALLTTANTAFWQNDGRPVFILSADCLDGYFVNTHNSGLGETFLRLEDVGSAAHWSSSGFGFSSEHSVLHSGFYEGMFIQNLSRIGDAIDYAKIQYELSGRYYSELISFILLGDPAMFLINPNITIPPQGAQTILLEQGWNMISSYIDPLNPSLRSLLAVPPVEICKNNAGNVFWPSLNINTIGEWQVDEGLQCYSSVPTAVNLTGFMAIPEESPLDLTQGWNMIPYLRSSPLAINVALNSLASQLFLAKNNTGHVYWPSLPLNDIGDMQPGQGYQVYLTGPGTLVYADN
jgi:hypothetical protein